MGADKVSRSMGGKPGKAGTETDHVRAKKHLGQHFLKDKRIAAAIVEALKAPDCDSVLEVGPGMGVLTHFLAERNLPA